MSDALSQIRFDNTYAELPERFYVKQDPARVPAPKLIGINSKLAEELSIDPHWLESPEGVAMLAGNFIPDGAEPLAQAYAGHQFGGFVPQLGDGRAILLGEVNDKSNTRRDIQLKGSGRTPFSRGGDGKAALGPVIREYIVSEAMAALGVPTTRALGAVTTGESVLRQEGSLPGAVFTRVASSHIRVGTFQYFAAQKDTDSVRILADYAIARHYPSCLATADPAAPYKAFLKCVVTAQAELIAQWMSFGFIHGVMNTDNTAISGETIDYGPCAFIDALRKPCCLCWTKMKRNPSPLQKKPSLDFPSVSASNTCAASATNSGSPRTRPSTMNSSRTASHSLLTSRSTSPSSSGS